MQPVMLLQGRPLLEKEHTEVLLDMQQHAARVWQVGLKKPVLFEIGLINVDYHAKIHLNEGIHKFWVIWDVVGCRHVKVVQIIFKAVAPKIDSPFPAIKNLERKLELFG